MRVAGVSRAEVDEVVAADMATWEGDSLLLFGFDEEGLTAVNARRQNGHRGGRPRKTDSLTESKPVGKPVGFDSVNLDETDSLTESKPLSSPLPSSPNVGGAPAPAIPDGLYAGPREGMRPLDRFAAANSAAFERVFLAYPRKDARVPASHVFQLAAQTFPGGEEALASAMLAAFPAMLKRAPYNGPNEKRPFLEKVIAEWRWNDPASAPDPAPKDSPRCWYHQKPFTNGRPSPKGPDRLCPECKHVAAASGTREAEPTTPPAPSFTPPPAWTTEEKAEYERIRRGEATEAQTATGGNP